MSALPPHLIDELMDSREPPPTATPDEANWWSRGYLTGLQKGASVERSRVAARSEWMATRMYDRKGDLGRAFESLARRLREGGG
jgi:hypothetical protein